MRFDERRRLTAALEHAGKTTSGAKARTVRRMRRQAARRSIKTASLLLFQIERYKAGRFWAVYADQEGVRSLVCVCVYKKGAQEIVQRLSCTTPQK